MFILFFHFIQQQPPPAAIDMDDGDDDYSTYVRVIPTAEEKLPCHTEKCDKDAAVSWASNSNRNDIRNFCEGCQVDDRGGWLNGVVPIKYLADSNDGDNTQAEQLVASSPPQVIDLLNICTDDFSIICLSLFNEMIPVGLQKFCLKIVGLCDTYTMDDGKLMFALKPGPILKPIEKNKYVFKALIDEYCKPLSALVTILESNCCLLNLFPLVLKGELHMHSDRKIQHKVGGVERWCLNISDKNMKLQQQGNRDNHVVFNYMHGNLVCMSDEVRGIVEIADGVRLIHGCPKAVMEAVGSYLCIIYHCYGCLF